MGAIVFDNEIFDSWLTKKSDEILSKVDREAISTEEMLILILKAQTNHFYHMDIEFREEFKKVDLRFEKMESEFNEDFRKIDDQFHKINSNIDTRFEKVYTDFQLEFKKVDEQLDKMNSKIDDRFEKVNLKIDDRFEKVNLKIDDRFEKVWSFQKWQAGILFGLFAGLYLKLFLG
jgi:hypothetical protein